MFETNMLSLILSTLFICMASGLISGFVYFFSSLSHKEVLPKFGAMWFPGLIFGLLFGVLNLKTTELVISFASLSAIIYYIAVRITYLLIRPAVKIWNLVGTFRKVVFSIISGVASGAFGALALALTLKLFSSIQLNIFTEFITTTLGASAGAVFVLEKRIGFEIYERVYGGWLIMFFMTCFDFLLWQVLVGMALELSLAFGKPVLALEGFDVGFTKFLLGPTVQLIGLIASFFGIISYFKREKAK